jgi:hypothetical protein
MGQSEHHPYVTWLVLLYIRTKTIVQTNYIFLIQDQALKKTTEAEEEEITNLK